MTSLTWKPLVGLAMGVYVLGTVACSSADVSIPPLKSKTGGKSPKGSALGGTAGAGAVANAAGGTVNAQGGSLSSTGGGPSAGGTPNTGGAPGTGGASSNGGAATTGGKATGGGTTTGGSTSTGGTATGGGTIAGGTTGTGGTATGGGTTGGTTGTGGAGTGGKATGGTSTGGSGTGGAAAGGGPNFSFFVTSLAAMQQLSGDANGFGGDLKYGMPTGLEGADKICQTIATNEGFGYKTWKAFLSTSTANAIDRVGTGPWYDRLGRLVATGVPGLLGARPDGVTAVVNDLPDEKGVQDHTANSAIDDHDTPTGSNTTGKLYSANSTCSDWTSLSGSSPMAGHSWPGGPSTNWIQAHTMPGCARGVCLSQAGGGCGTPCPTGGIGCSGGYGGIYCFALSP